MVDIQELPPPCLSSLQPGFLASLRPWKSSSCVLVWPWVGMAGLGSTHGCHWA